MQVHDFEFNKVTNEVVDKIVNKINIKKATGADGIPATIVNFVLNISFHKKLRHITYLFCKPSTLINLTDWVK
jgi:hypothetical protein